MAGKNDAQVIINGKVYTLCGYESPEYLQKVASYIDSKQSEFKLTEGYKKLDLDMRNLLLNLNIADDYYKAKKQVEELEEILSIQDKEMYDLKHDIIASKSKLETAEREIEALKKEAGDFQKNITRLETELEDSKKNRK